MNLTIIKLLVFFSFSLLILTQGIEFIIYNKHFSLFLAALLVLSTIIIYLKARVLYSQLEVSHSRDAMIQGSTNLHMQGLIVLNLSNFLHLLIGSTLSGLVVLAQLSFAFALYRKIKNHIKE